MCLVVSNIPTGKNAIIQKCYKEVRKKGHKKFATPFRNFRIPNTGILSCDETRLRHRYIYGDHIHAFMESKIGDMRNKFLAYAINVKAEGYNDLVCKLLYIPELDFTGKRSDIAGKLEFVLNSTDNIDFEYMKKIFPDHQRSFPCKEKIDWSAILKEANIHNLPRYSDYDDPMLLKKLLRSRSFGVLLNKMSYDNLLDRFRKAYNSRVNT